MDDDNLIPISALQHYLYCRRQCALIHVERLWAENRQTAEGRLLHKRTDQPSIESRKGIRTVTAMPLVDTAIGITGVADVVEFHRRDNVDYPFPVEYKRGRPKAHRADEVQLCAQGLCLESMLGLPVHSGALYYGQSARRQTVTFDEELRKLTRQIIGDTRTLIASGRTPVVSYDSRRCDACSLIELCQPRLLNRLVSVQSWLDAQLDE
jgi:CRISPR-associated exonuclease Cas4